jgi:hypothetical protein
MGGGLKTKSERKVERDVDKMTQSDTTVKLTSNPAKKYSMTSHAL